MKQLAHLKIGTRLALGFALLIALMMTLAAVSYTRIEAMAHDIEMIVHDRFVKVAQAQRMENEVNRQLRAMRTAMIARAPDTVTQELHKLEESTPVVANLLQQLQASVRDTEGKAALAAVVGAREPFRKEEAVIVELIRAGRADEARDELLNKVIPLQTAYLQAIEAFGESQVRGMETYGAEAATLARQAELLTLVLAAAALAMAVLVAAVLTRSITVPIRKAVQVAHTVAGGDLSSRIEPRGRDELAELLGALRSMNDGLVRIVREVRDCSDSIATGSHQIAVGGVDLSQRTEEQASSVQQTAASMEQIATSVRHSADTSRTATELARNASSVASGGGQAMAGVVSTMGAITDSSRRIADITGVIDGIAFQTNILALNAAVEAARAGEQGRGFAVVAGEVRNLAQRAATAAKDIKGLIGERLERVEAGAQQVEQAGATMGDIVTQAGKVSELIGELGAGFEEQSRGISQVNDAVGQMDQTTQQNAALVEESAAAAESLRLQAARLTELVGTFRLA